MPGKESKTGACEGCSVKRRITRFDMRRYPHGCVPGGVLIETWLCTSCSKVSGLHALMDAVNYTGQMLLMVNSKLDLLKGAR